jgi:hypothetical protein
MTLFKGVREEERKKHYFSLLSSTHLDNVEGSPRDVVTRHVQIDELGDGDGLDGAVGVFEFDLDLRERRRDDVALLARFGGANQADQIRQRLLLQRLGDFRHHRLGGVDGRVHCHLQKNKVRNVERRHKIRRTFGEEKKESKFQAMAVVGQMHPPHPTSIIYHLCQCH